MSLKTTMNATFAMEGRKPLCKFRFDLSPRGGANRPYADALAEAILRSDELRPHVVRVTARTSSVELVLKPGIDATRAVLAWTTSMRRRSVETHEPFHVAAAG